MNLASLLDLLDKGLCKEKTTFYISVSSSYILKMILFTAVSQKHQIPRNKFYERCTPPHGKTTKLLLREIKERRPT